MGEYFSSIIAVSLLCGVIEALAPHTSGLDRHVRRIGLLIILCIALSPLSDLIGSISDGLLDDLKNEISGKDEMSEDYRERLNEYLNNYSAELLKGELYGILSERFSIPQEECEIILEPEYANGQYCVAKVVILLSGGSIFKNPYNIEDYIADLLSCKCEVLIKDSTRS